MFWAVLTYREVDGGVDKETVLAMEQIRVERSRSAGTGDI